MGAMIKQTKNYNRFETHEKNRPITRKLIEDLKGSFEKFGWLDSHPMHVVKNGSGKLRIITGHHRFEAAKDLNIPVKYVEGKDLGVFDLERPSKKWSLRDYVYSFASSGNEDYQYLQEFLDEHNIPVMSAIAILMGYSAPPSGATLKNVFATGKFVVTDEGIETADKVINIISAIRSVSDIVAVQGYLITSIVNLLFLDDFDYKRLIKKIVTFPYLVKRCAGQTEYLEMLEKIYNFKVKASEKKPVAFMAREAARERQKKNQHN